MIYLWMRMTTGLTLNEVTYKGGGPAMVDAIGGQIQLVFTSLAAGIPHVKSGRLKALGVTSATRHPAMPDIQTFQEAGLKDMAVVLWYGVLAPAGTPRDVVDRLHHEIVRAIGNPRIAQQFTNLDTDAVASTPQEFSALIKSEIVKWAKVTKAANITAE
jgi:tripartite-type tricarboxylate transporter receptor subunit TctC